MLIILRVIIFIRWQSIFVFTDSSFLRSSFDACRLGVKFWLWHLLILGKLSLSGPVSSSKMGWGGGVRMRGNIYLPPLADGKCGVWSLVNDYIQPFLPQPSSTSPTMKGLFHIPSGPILLVSC